MVIVESESYEYTFCVRQMSDNFNSILYYPAKRCYVTCSSLYCNKWQHTSNGNISTPEAAGNTSCHMHTMFHTTSIHFVN